MNDKDFEDLRVHFEMIVRTLNPNPEEVFKIHRIICGILSKQLDSKMVQAVVDEFKRAEEIDEIMRSWNHG